MSNPALDLLQSRRSVKLGMLGEPGPSADELDRILACAARVPDHKGLAPWRFVVFDGEARRRFGEVMARVAAEEEKEPLSQVRLDTERGRFLRAPVVVAVVSRTAPNPGAPEWEQVLSCGAAAFNLCLAANALGFGSNWVTGWAAYSAGINRAMALADNERIAGFVYIGSAKERQADRERPQLDRIVSRWQG